MKRVHVFFLVVRHSHIMDDFYLLHDVRVGPHLRHAYTYAHTHTRAWLDQEKNVPFFTRDAATTLRNSVRERRRWVQLAHHSWWMCLVTHTRTHIYIYIYIMLEDIWSVWCTFGVHHGNRRGMCVCVCSLYSRNQLWKTKWWLVVFFLLVWNNFIWYEIIWTLDKIVEFELELWNCKYEMQFTAHLKNNINKVN